MIQNQILDLFFKAKSSHISETIRFAQKGGTFQTIHKRFEIEMNACGFVLVGVGLYSSVWRRDGRYYKINSNVNGVFDGFYIWMQACIKHAGNPCLPTFGEIVQVGQRYCVEVGRLEPQYTINGAESLYRAGMTNRYLREAVLLALQTCADENEVIKGKFDNMPADAITVRKIETFLDVHSHNIMRLNGQVVLNDPIAYLSGQIPVCEVVKYA